MKKIFAAFLAFAMLTALFACAPAEEERAAFEASLGEEETAPQ